MNNINNCNEEKELIFPTWEERISGIDTELAGERQEGDSHWLQVADMPKAYRRYYERLEAKERRKEERKKLWLRSLACGVGHEADTIGLARPVLSAGERRRPGLNSRSAV